MGRRIAPSFILLKVATLVVVLAGIGGILWWVFNPGNQIKIQVSWAPNDPNFVVRISRKVTATARMEILNADGSDTVMGVLGVFPDGPTEFEVPAFIPGSYRVVLKIAQTLKVIAESKVFRIS